MQVLFLLLYATTAVATGITLFSGKALLQMPADNHQVKLPMLLKKLLEVLMRLKKNLMPQGQPALAAAGHGLF